MLNGLIGFLLGILSGLGIGGGSLLLLWLTGFCGIELAQARSVNLLFFLPCALGAGFIRLKRQSLHIRPLLPAIAAGCISAMLFQRLSAFLPVSILRKGFGALLLLSAVRELRWSDP